MEKKNNPTSKLHAKVYPIRAACLALIRHIAEKHWQPVTAGDALLGWFSCQKGIGTSLKGLQPVGDLHWSRDNREQSRRHGYLWSEGKPWSVSQQKETIGWRTRKSHQSEHLSLLYHPHLVRWTLIGWAQLTENIQKVEVAESEG